MYTGQSGSIYDTRVFAQSSIYTRGVNGMLYPNWTSINGNEVPIVILGDSAYPLLDWLIKPFPHKGTLTQGQKQFNYHLSTARVVSENAFGRLKGQWQCLIKCIDMKPEKIPIVITACCTLHYTE